MDSIVAHSCQFGWIGWRSLLLWTCAVNASPATTRFRRLQKRPRKNYQFDDTGKKSAWSLSEM